MMKFNSINYITFISLVLFCAKSAIGDAGYADSPIQQKRPLTAFEKANPLKNCNSSGWCDDQKSVDTKKRIRNARRGTQESCTTDGIYDISYPLILVSFNCPSLGEVTVQQMTQHHWKYSNVDRTPATGQLGSSGVVISIIFEK